MLSNALWMMPTADRAASTGTATIYYRCGSQAGKAAQSVSAEITAEEFAALTAGFVVEQIEIYRRAQSARQKNAARNLKKYFDSREVAIIEHAATDVPVAQLAHSLL
jgi:hypothetical protein